MKTWMRYVLVTALIAGATVGIATTSSATSFPAFIGQPQAPADYTCFVNSGGAVFNFCGVTKRFCAALLVSSSDHNVEINVLAPDINHNVACFAQAVTRDHLSAGITGFMSPGVFGSSQMLHFPTLSVPGAGGLYACCDIAPSASIQSFNY
jgi:hypothetical protein